MEPHVFVAVIAAAAMHAGWNALLKLRLDPFSSVTLLATACSLIALPALAVTGWPRAAAWPFIVASLALHFGYYLTLSAAYARADMSQVYPIARGGAPLLTAITSWLLVGETVAPLQGLGIALLGCAVAALSVAGRRRGTRFDPLAIGLAGATAAMICSYTLVDGLGARAAADPHAYSAALFALEAIPVLAFGFWRRGPAMVAPLLPFWRQGLAGGAMSLAAYWIVIWAMTVAPIPLVGALRETSVLFAAAIAVVFLREPMQWQRAAAACVILTGLALIRLG